MGIEDAKNWLSTLAILLSVGSVIYAFLTSRSRGNEKHLAESDEKLAKHDRRLTKLEGDFEHLPTKEAQHRLELAISELAGDMKQMTEAQKGTQNTVVRMENVLLDRGSK